MTIKPVQHPDRLALEIDVPRFIREHLDAEAEPNEFGVIHTPHGDFSKSPAKYPDAPRGQKTWQWHKPGDGSARPLAAFVAEWFGLPDVGAEIEDACAEIAARHKASPIPSTRQDALSLIGNAERGAALLRKIAPGSGVRLSADGRRFSYTHPDGRFPRSGDMVDLARAAMGASATLNDALKKIGSAAPFLPARPNDDAADAPTENLGEFDPDLRATIDRSGL